MFSLKRNTHLTSHLDLVSFLDRSNIGNAETAGMYVKIFTHVTVLLIASSLIERVPSTKLRTTATKKTVWRMQALLLLTTNISA